MPDDAVAAVKAHNLVFNFVKFAAFVTHHDRATANTHGWRGKPPNLDNFAFPLRMVFKRVGSHDLNHFCRGPVDVSTRTFVVPPGITPICLAVVTWPPETCPRRLGRGGMVDTYRSSARRKRQRG